MRSISTLRQVADVTLQRVLTAPQTLREQGTPQQAGVEWARVITFASMPSDAPNNVLRVHRKDPSGDWLTAEEIVGVNSYSPRMLAPFQIGYADLSRCHPPLPELSLVLITRVPIPGHVLAGNLTWWCHERFVEYCGT